MITALLIALILGALILGSGTDEDAGRFDRRTLDRLQRQSRDRGWKVIDGEPTATWEVRQ